MPRLVGKQSNSGLSVGLFLLISIAVLGALEYVGAVDLIPSFGAERDYLQGTQMPNTDQSE